MRPAVHLQTSYGFELYRNVDSMYQEAQSLDAVHAFRQVMREEKDKVESIVVNFLDDDEISKKYKMDDSDSEGWEFYKQASDRFSVLNHFSERE